MRPSALAILLPLLVAAPSAQGLPAPGHRLYQVAGLRETRLIDVSGAIVHTWPSPQPVVQAYLLPDGSLMRATVDSTFGIPGTTGRIERVALDGTVLWSWQAHGPDFVAHHDFVPMPDGNVLLIVWELLTRADAIAAGRDPASATHAGFYPDALIEVRPTGPTSGEVVWRWRLWDHLIQDFDPAMANFGAVANHPERVDLNYPPVVLIDGDWNHMNGIDYDPVQDWVVVSARQQNEVWIIDHSTTTAEAAGRRGGRRGRGGDLLYRWGDPAAHRAGTAADRQLGLQHDPRFIPPGRPGAGNLTIFNNQWQPNRSAVFEIVLPLDPAGGGFVLGSNGRYGPAAPVWRFDAPLFFSAFVSSAERLPNGNTLVCAGSQGGLFEVDAAGTMVWLHGPPGLSLPIFQCHYVQRTLWADAEELSARGGGTVSFDLIAGRPAAGLPYLLLGSASGTAPGFQLGGLHVPLNPDFLLAASAQGAGSGMFVNTFGVLGPLGRGAAALALPGGAVPVAGRGLDLDFAFVVASPSWTVLHASNPVPLRLLR